MKDSLLDTLRLFLQKHYEKQKPLILGFSGGVDSTCLLHLLLALQDEFKIPLHLVHIDHRWRKDSQQEAQTLYDKIKKLPVSYHRFSLEINQLDKNIEDYFRKKRLQIFQNIYVKIKAHALLLAHHGDDLEETVFKRILEGAGLPQIYGMKKISSINNMMVYRPLLAVRKKDLLFWLKNNNCSYLVDPTNFDLSNYRSKYRKKIYPYIAKNFGKNFSENLLSLSRSSLEMKEYLDKKIESFWEKMILGPLGATVDFSLLNSCEPLEKKYFLRQILTSLGLTSSHQHIHRICEWVEMNAANKMIRFKQWTVGVDRKRVYIFKNFEFDRIPLKEGRYDYSFGRVEVEKKLYNKTDLLKLGIEQLFLGKIHFYLPIGQYYLSPVHSRSSWYYKKMLNKWWLDHKIPSFMRVFFPLIYKKKEPVLEILTGKTLHRLNPKINYQITITFN